MNASSASSHTSARPYPGLSSGRSDFLSGQRTCTHPRTLVPRKSRANFQIQNFKFLKTLGLKKPSFLPDFGKDKRLAVLNRFYTSLDKATYNELLSDDFKFTTLAEDHKAYGKAEYTKLVAEIVKPAIPDFSWNHVTTGNKTDDGFSTVTIQASGTHNGEALQLPGLSPIEPAGKSFRLAKETQKIRVEDGKIQEIQVEPVKGAGPRALYLALGGKA